MGVPWRLEQNVQPVEHHEAEQRHEIDPRTPDIVGSIKARDQMQKDIGDREPATESLLPLRVLSKPKETRRDDVRAAEGGRHLVGDARDANTPGFWG